MQIIPYLPPEKFRCITDPVDLCIYVNALAGAPWFTIDTETTGLDTATAELVGVSLAYPVNAEATDFDAAYIPIAHKDKSLPQIPLGDVLYTLRPIIEGDQIKALHNGGYDLSLLSKYGLTFGLRTHDTMFMSYVLGGGKHGHGMDELAMRHFQYNTVKFDEVRVTELGHETFADVPILDATYYAAEDSYVTAALFAHLRSELKAHGLIDTYLTVDAPLMPVLADMKFYGVGFDRSSIEGIKSSLQTEIVELEREIIDMAGREVVLGSTQDLGKLLFAELHLPSHVKTKTGAQSTGKEALEKIENEHPIIPLIQEWKEVAKLQSSFTDTLLEAQNKATGRIHASFNATFTNTGRLSCSNPNLQQAPKRSERGKVVRRAFVPGPGNLMFAGDYSQIELRVLAHITGDPTLLEAFHSGLDIHQATAAKVLGKAFADVTPEERQHAKTSNFLIIYGGGPKKLAAQARIPVRQAEKFIADYFANIPGVPGWIEETKKFARQHGYSETLFGRRIYTPLAQSGDQYERFRGERQAVNGVIQGTSADLMRLGMIKAAHELRKFHPDIKLLMSVHDELVGECPATLVAPAFGILQHAMETAADEFMTWEVPIIAEGGVGNNWLEAKPIGKGEPVII